MSPVPCRRRAPLLTRGAAAVAGAVLAVSALAACGDDSAGEDAGVTLEDLRTLEERVRALEGEITELEEAGVNDEAEGYTGNVQSLIGDEITVSGRVAEVDTATVAGTVFYIGPEDDPVAVVSPVPVTGLEADDVVRVTGNVHQVEEVSFQEDFGLHANELYDDPEPFFRDSDIAIAAEEVEIIPEAALEGDD